MGYRNEFWAFLDRWALGKLKGRVVYLPESIQDYNMEKVQKAFISLMLDEGPIVVVCDSGGGNVGYAQQLALLMDTWKSQVFTVVEKEAASAAVWVFAAGGCRIMQDKAQLGTHATRHSSDGKIAYEIEVYRVLAEHSPKFYKNIYDTVKAGEAECRGWLEKYAGRVLPEAIFKKDMTWHDVTLARGLGFADEGHAAPYFRVWWLWRRRELAAKVQKLKLRLFTKRERRPV